MDIDFSPLTGALDAMLAERQRMLLAIDGMCTAGKTTLASRLERRYGCTVLHMDDFFLRPEQRSVERYAEIGGNVDYERFLAEVLEPLHRGESFSYRPYDCRSCALSAPVAVTPGRLCVIEGSYSMHPTLEGFYDLSAFLFVTPERQRERVLQRPEFLHESFFTRWIPMENRYFSETRARERCTLAFDCG